MGNKVHKKKHPLTGKKVLLKDNLNKYNGVPSHCCVSSKAKAIIKGWWSRQCSPDRPVHGSDDLVFVEGVYLDRIKGSDIPLDENIIYVKIDGIGGLIHESEIDQEIIERG